MDCRICGHLIREEQDNIVRINGESIHHDCVGARAAKHARRPAGWMLLGSAGQMKLSVVQRAPSQTTQHAD